MGVRQGVKHLYICMYIYVCMYVHTLFQKPKPSSPAEQGSVVSMHIHSAHSCDGAGFAWAGKDIYPRHPAGEKKGQEVYFPGLSL